MYDVCFSRFGFCNPAPILHDVSGLVKRISWPLASMTDSNTREMLVRALAGPLDLAVQASVDEGSVKADSLGEGRCLKLIL
jgi:hypothetical protein